MGFRGSLISEQSEGPYGKQLVREKGPWREAGPPNHHDDKVDSDQRVSCHRCLHANDSKGR